MKNENIFCDECGFFFAYQHSHKPDFSGVDDGPPLKVRKKADPKPPDIMANIRKIAWETRRMKWGARGHR